MQATNWDQESQVRFSFISERKKSLIYHEVLEILQYTGAEIHHPFARKLLSEHGCTVTETRAYIPSQLVKVALSTVPPVTTIHHWDRSGRLRIEPYKTYFGPGPTCPYFIDPYTDKRRRYLRQDAATVAKICDALPEIGFIMSLGSISDVTDGLEEVYEFAEMIQNSCKPIIAWCYSKEHCRAIHKIASVVAGGRDRLRHRPIYFFYNEPISPLTCDFNAVDKLIYCAENGIPQIFAPANTGGATVPATCAAHLVVTLAESLLGVVISQLVNPGACVIIGGTQSVLDMRRMVFTYGAPELSILSIGLSEMSEYIGLPVFVAAGCSDSKDTDVQSAIETAFSLNSAVLAEANLVHDIGFLESGMTGSVFQLVLADEILSMSRFIARGIKIDDESLAVEEINDAGPQGNYRSRRHSQKWSKLHWSPKLMDRQAYEDWQRSGAREMKQRVRDRVQQLLKEHIGAFQKLSSSTKAAIETILQETEKAKRGSEP